MMSETVPEGFSRIRDRKPSYGWHGQQLTGLARLERIALDQKPSPGWHTQQLPGLALLERIALDQKPSTGWHAEQLPGLPPLEQIALDQARAYSAQFRTVRFVPFERIPDARPDALPEPPRAARHRGGHGDVPRGGDPVVLAPREVRNDAVAPSAWRSRSAVACAVSVLLAIATAWGFEHAMNARSILSDGGTTLGALYLVTFVILLWQAVLYAVDRPRRTAARHAVEALRTVVAVPCYNEDPAILRRSLLSMLAQTRLPDHVFVVDDGSNQADYTQVRREFHARAAAVRVKVSWVRTPNGGKRHAHAVAVRGTPEADVYITIDSDGILDAHAIEELLAPFADRTVQSVAGIVLSANNRGTVLARILDLLYLPAQLTNRAGLSVMGSVMVNSGALAAYRADAVREALPIYLGETFFGRPVGFSDDSMLTLLAYLRGRTLQQSTSFVFAAMPERVSHHARQYLRWMRGSFIRSWWRFRYLPVRSYAYWWHLLSWMLTAVATWAFTDLYIIGPLEGQFRISYLVVPVLLGYATALPYLTVRRSDEPFWSRVLTWLLAPLAILWSYTALRAWRWYGALTCRKTGWGTRQTVEVTLEGADA